MKLTRWSSGGRGRRGLRRKWVPGPEPGEPSQAIFPFWTTESEDWSELMSWQHCAQILNWTTI